MGLQNQLDHFHLGDCHQCNYSCFGQVLDLLDVVLVEDMVAVDQNFHFRLVSQINSEGRRKVSSYDCVGEEDHLQYFEGDPESVAAAVVVAVANEVGVVEVDASFVKTEDFVIAVVYL